MRPLLFAPLLSLLACSAPSETPVSPAPIVPDLQIESIPFGTVESTAAGVCFAQAAPQTQTRIVTEQVEIVPAVVADDGRVVTPAVFRDQSRPATEIVRDGAKFEALCPMEFTPERLQTLQRALTVRQAYAGPITGVLDTATQTAIQQFQAAQGIDSPVLSRTNAEMLGIVPVTVLRADLPEN